MVIKIGPAGTGGSNLSAFEDISKKGLDALEIEFVYSIWMTKTDAEKIRELNKKLNLTLSIHAPYYINLNSEEKSKINASKSRILKCCEIGAILGAKYIVFHAGFYQKKSKQETFENIKKEIIEMNEIIKKNKWNVLLCPETTGKQSQFGDLDELLSLKKETNCHLCVDFSHLKARYNGKIDYEYIFTKLEKLKTNIPCHFSGIEYTEKGERRHILTSDEYIKELFSHIKKHNLDLSIINESPDPVGDALKMKKILGV